MRRLTSIVAVNPKGVIGRRNALPWRVRSDLQFFKQQTRSNIVVMGRRTFDSLGQIPLPDRLNIVLTHNLSLIADQENLIGASSIEEALMRIDDSPSQYSDAFVIGGETMYCQFAEYVDRYLVTIINKHVSDGDAFFDESIIGDERDWSIKLLGLGVADGNNEADFEIIEATSRFAEIVSEKRIAAVSQYRAKAAKWRKRPAYRPTRDNSLRSDSGSLLTQLA